MKGRTNIDGSMPIHGTLGTYTVADGNTIVRGDFVEVNGSSVQAYAGTSGWALGLAKLSGNAGDSITVYANSI